MTVEIELQNHDIALVDDEDFDFVRGFVWYRIRNNKGVHGACTVVEGKSACMHRMILGLDSKEFRHLSVRHINKNKLDNRKENLRVQTFSQAASWCPPRSETGFKGVHADRRRGTYWASIFVQGEFHYLGKFPSAKAAAIAYNKAARTFWGDAVINERVSA